MGQISTIVNIMDKLIFPNAGHRHLQIHIRKVTLQ